MFVKLWLHTPISSSWLVERGEVERSLFAIGKFSPSPLTFGGPPSLKNINYGLHQNTPFKKTKFKNFLTRRTMGECFCQAPLWLSMSLSLTEVLSEFLEWRNRTFRTTQTTCRMTCSIFLSDVLMGIFWPTYAGKKPHLRKSVHVAYRPMPIWLS